MANVRKSKIEFLFHTAHVAIEKFNWADECWSGNKADRHNFCFPLFASIAVGTAHRHTRSEHENRKPAWPLLCAVGVEANQKA